ncbi:MAG: ATP-binding cassette domain-containing protein, partial [Rhodospirillaceae bacterium]|nr:ATP-binding cassette domain-containing protein [Rhodospirillaceae bacterium]
MAENLLTVEGLFAGYDGQPVLRDLTFDVPKGALIALIGPNGHGKTTLMRCIAGLLKPTTGKVEFSGKKVTGLPA